ncbi:MAG: nucleoside 2-deoxyribosyltransferase [Egibacteraceae bacterium]
MRPNGQLRTYASSGAVSVSQPAVFLAAPYEQLLDPVTALIDPGWRRRLELLRTGLLERRFDVFNAHHNERWGADWLPPHVCTPLDFAAIQAADVVCAVVGAPASGGVAVELGWASALGTPCVLLLEQESRHTSLIHSLRTIVGVAEVLLPAEWSPGFIDSVAAEVERLANQGTDRVPRVGPSTAGFVRRQTRGEPR